MDLILLRLGFTWIWWLQLKSSCDTSTSVCRFPKFVFVFKLLLFTWYFWRIGSDSPLSHRLILQGRGLGKTFIDVGMQIEGIIYKELRVHARRDHQLTRPSKIDPICQRSWSHMERRRDGWCSPYVSPNPPSLFMDCNASTQVINAYSMPTHI